MYARDMTNLDHALLLAERGYLTFALNSGGKPFANCEACRTDHHVAEDYLSCRCLLCHGTYAGTDDPERLGEMWTEHPESLIGIRTGLASNFFVLDFDVHEGGADGLRTLREMKNAGVLPQTVTALTGGGGVHLYYRYPEGVQVTNDNRGKLGPGADVKGDGGFVIAPPSRKSGRKAYRWYPGRSPEEQRLADCSAAVLAIVTKARQPQRVRPSGFEVDLSKVTTKEFKDALVMLEFAPAGSRNGALYQASCRGGEAIAVGAYGLDEVKSLLLHTYDLSGGRDKPSTVNGTIRSGIARGLNDYREEI